MNLICTYKLESKLDVENLRIKYIEQVIPLKDKREKLRQSFKKATNEADKTIIQAKIDIITEDINKTNSKIQTCKRIITKSEKGEKETYLIEKRVENNKFNNEKSKSKDKIKRQDRV